METDIALVISGVVATFVQILRSAGVSGKWGMAWAALFSLLGVLIYAFSYEPAFARILLWKYFAATGMVTLSAMGVFSAVKNAPDMVTNLTGVGRAMTASLKGTGNGKD